MNTDDPKLTAHALGELSPQEEEQMEIRLADSPPERQIVAEIGELAELLKTGYRAELRGARPVNLIDIRDDPWFWSKARPLAIAAVLAICALVALLVFPWTHETPRVSRSGPTSSGGPAEIIFQSPDFAPSGDMAEPGSSQTAGDTPFVLVRDHPRSTFPIHLGKDSYSDVARSINGGSFPRKEAVRVGEMINYFSYNYPRAEGVELFSISGEVSGCPWNVSHRLVRIGIRARETENRSAPIAREARAEVAFNPARVTSYRLISFEKGRAREDASTSSGNRDLVFSGETATALYEIVAGTEAAGSSSPQSGPDVLDVVLHYKRPGGATTESIKSGVADTRGTLESASPDFRFVAAVAEFGMILRDSDYKGSATLAAVIDLAQRGKGDDPDGKRASFIELARKALLIKEG